ncbi:MAG TPA: hypothetical protein VMW72_07130 [Sedimentisphaerales bacterium]|nr:hypothetical protein [Sedimentisphaerales bacterium]
MNPFTKLAAAAVIIIAVGICMYYFTGDGTTPVYGMSSLPELLRSAKNIYAKGWMYVPPIVPPGQERRKMVFEFWIDLENGRTRYTQPGTEVRDGKVTIKESQVISDGEYIMHIDHTERTVFFRKLSGFQGVLQTYQNLDTHLKQLFGNPEQMDKHELMGEEQIEGINYQIWEGEVSQVPTAGGIDARMKVRSWLSPHSGDLGRVKVRVKMGDKDWFPLMEIYRFERNTLIPEDVFATKPPEGYTLYNNKETAPTKELVMGSFYSAGFSFIYHINFKLSDGSVIFCWSSEDTNSQDSQAALFAKLQVGGSLPKLPVVAYGLKQIGWPSNGITYTGYHLAYTKKEGKFYEWGIYTPDKKPQPNDAFAYQTLHRFNPESIGGNWQLNVTLVGGIMIETADEFNVLVRGAMAELSDDSKTPEGITYNNVLQLTKQIRKSLAQ